ncbi:MAG: segregation/condensation protein A, partial [Candidatus Neomarinimicrobiota bacterium]|nr:segregation/condensation protein A [Candidatus Neomarinimicrobiota bacterium]
MHKVELDQFQGPLDLLLYFIRRDEIDIYDIPIAKITAEYLQIIEDMKSMNLSIAGEFILMAATLMRIKSKMLLPRPDLDELGEPIDPRTELVQQLIEYRKYKDIADNLS